MAEKILRGRVLRFLTEPDGIDDTAVLRLRRGRRDPRPRRPRRRRRRRRHRRSPRQPPAPQVVDHRPHLLMPGFIDTHIHMPQAQIIASWGAQLLDWLNTYTFPAESRFSDPAHAARIAGAFLDLLLAHGTTTAVAYCSSHPTSVDAYFAAAEARGLRMIGGKVMMDRNCPEGVRDTPQSSYDDSKALIAHWHGHGRASTPSPRASRSPRPRRRWRWPRRWSPSIPTCTCRPTSRRTATRSTSPSRSTPRPATTSTSTRPTACSARRASSATRSTSPTARPPRWPRPARSPSSARPPTSSSARGLYDKVGLREQGVRRAIATDVGGGTNYSMLRTLDEGYKVLALRGQKLDPLKAFWWITRGNAEALGLADTIGTFAPGTEADIVVLDSAATPAMALRARDDRPRLPEELFLLETLGDDRAIAATYVAGERWRPGGVTGQETSGTPAR